MPVMAWSIIDILQLLLAIVLGSLIGFERELRDKPAGVKTITAVTLCSVLLMQLSIKLPQTAGQAGAGDPTRLAAAVMTGIGFLGAGVILQRGAHIEGITTAAAIWTMAGVGLAIGSGYYLPAMLVVALMLIGFIADPLLDRFTTTVKRRLGLPNGEEEKKGDER